MPYLLEGQETLLLEGPKEEEGQWSGSYMGGGPGEPGWYPPYGEEPGTVDAEFEDITPPGSTGRSEREKLASKILRERGEFEGEQRKTALEELRAKRRQYRREYRPQAGKWVKTYLKPRPQMDLARIFFPGKALRETYIPKAPVKTTEAQIQGLREEVAPRMGMESLLGQAVLTKTGSLRRAGTPPPTPVIRAPSRSPEEFEGLGPALVRLRKLGELEKVDRAVLAEVQANGDIDTPTHVKSEVGRLGFSSKEVDDSLKRLRDHGFILPTGRILNGEKELMLSGGSHG